MVMTDIKELDCRRVVVMNPIPRLLYTLSVDFVNNFWSGPFTKTLNPSSNMIIPKIRIATPAAIFSRFGLTKNAQPRKTSISGKKNFFVIANLKDEFMLMII
jgi:hypothetical protein